MTQVSNASKSTKHVSRIATGVVAAALLSAAFGCLIIPIAHQTMLHSRFLAQWAVGSETWIPQAKAIGSSYPVQEAVALGGWLISWFGLHLWWRKRSLSLKPVLWTFWGLLTAATAIAWRPIGNMVGDAIAQLLNAQ